MQLECDISAALGYTSQPQISRVLSEKWFQNNGYCLSCDNDRLLHTAANTKACDFVCQTCNENYELKTFRTRPARTLVDGAYAALLSRIQSESVPTLMLLERNDDWQIQGLTAIHHLFLTPEVIEKRKPLSLTARRAGWVGCNIRLDLIAQDAQIQVVHNQSPNNPQIVRERFQRFNRLKDIEPSSRGWATLTLRIVRSLNQQEFSLNEIYTKEGAFASIYPKNNNIRAKVRQQLQVLRDLGYLEFCGRGSYRLLI
jgi:type II restriction enzyme